MRTFASLCSSAAVAVSVTSVHVANASGYTRQLYIYQDDFTQPIDTIGIDTSVEQDLFAIHSSPVTAALLQATTWPGRT